MDQIDVLVVGSVNMDLNTTVASLPERGETIRSRSFSTAAGGKGANQAVAAARMGGRVAMICAVGRDEYGPVLWDGLTAEGIDLSGAARVDGPSGIAVITIEVSGQNTIVIVPGANTQVTPAAVENNAALFERAKVVVLQLEVPMETVLAAAKMGQKHGCVVILNPAPAAELPEELFSYLDVVTPNETEAAAITAEKDDEVAAQALLDRGVSTAVVTRGEHGAIVASEAGIESYPSFAVNAVDATAAGDAFNGALATRLAAGESISQALPWALATGALAVTKLGAQPGLPRKDEVAELLETR